MNKHICSVCKFRDFYRENGMVFNVCVLTSTFINDIDIPQFWCKKDEAIIVE
jgi:hypothetical protein